MMSELKVLGHELQSGFELNIAAEGCTPDFRVIEQKGAPLFADGSVNVAVAGCRFGLRIGQNEPVVIRTDEDGEVRIASRRAKMLGQPGTKTVAL